LDEAADVGGEQRADRSERSSQSRCAARQDWTGAGHRKRRAVPRFRRCPATWPARSLWSTAAWRGRETSVELNTLMGWPSARAGAAIC